jgi:hypothetical protein
MLLQYVGTFKLCDKDRTDHQAKHIIGPHLWEARSKPDIREGPILRCVSLILFSIME